MENLYDILGIDRKADTAAIKRAYFVMAKKYHPDSGEESEVKKFYEVSEAYQILSDPIQKKAYDLSLKTGKAEEPLVEEVIQSSPATYQRSMDDAEYAYRQQEMHHYRRGVFVKAMLRVIIVTLLFAAVGYFLVRVLGGHVFVGFGAGMVFGFFLSVNRNFDLKTFIHDKQQRAIAEYGSWLLMAGSMIYFLFLFLSQLFGAV